MITSIDFTADTEFELVTLAQAKKQIRLDDSFGTGEDEEIQDCINDAQNEAVIYMNRLIEQGELVITLDEWQQNVLFSDWRIISAAKVEYIPAEGTGYTELTADNYRLSKTAGLNHELRFTVTDLPEVEPGESAIKITLTCDMHPSVRRAVLLKTATNYTRREDYEEGNNSAFHALLRQFRKHV